MLLLVHGRDYHGQLKTVKSEVVQKNAQRIAFGAKMYVATVAFRGECSLTFRLEGMVQSRCAWYVHEWSGNGSKWTRMSVTLERMYWQVSDKSQS